MPASSNPSWSSTLAPLCELDPDVAAGVAAAAPPPPESPPPHAATRSAAPRSASATAERVAVRRPSRGREGSDDLRGFMV